MKLINPFHKRKAIEIVKELNNYIKAASAETDSGNALLYFQQVKTILLRLKPFYNEGVISLTPDFETLFSQVQKSIDALSISKPTASLCKFCEIEFATKDLSERGLCPKCEQNVSKIMPAIFREISSEYHQLNLDPTGIFMMQIPLVETMLSQAGTLLPYEKRGLIAFTPSIHELMIDLNYRLKKFKNPPQNTFYCKHITYQHPQRKLKNN